MICSAVTYSIRLFPYTFRVSEVIFTTLSLMFLFCVGLSCSYTEISAEWLISTRMLICLSKVLIYGKLSGYIANNKVMNQLIACFVFFSETHALVM